MPIVSASSAQTTAPRPDRRSGWRTARTLRRVLQLSLLALYVFLLFAALQRRAAFPLADVFFRFDPLSALTSMVSRRAWLPHFEPAIVTVAATVVLGRVWCGWVCPLGTVAEYVSFGQARRRAKRLAPRLRLVKYLLLVAIVAMAALGSLTLLVLDPLAMLTRTMTTALIPAFDLAVTKVESGMMHVGWLVGVVSWAETHLRGQVLPIKQPYFGQGLALFALLTGVLALNAFAPRFWCRYLCPLGALLGLIAKVAVLRPFAAAGCGSCERCAAACRLDAIEPMPASPVHVASSECTACLDCQVACGRPDGMRFGLDLAPAWEAYDPNRRQFLAATAAGLGAVVLLQTGVWRQRPSSRLLRPPGVTDESAFLAACLRCSQCMRVCPTFGLQPTLGEAGLEGIWSPILKPRIGYCDYACNACGQTCPSGAIPRLSLSEKRKQVIGVAAIDRDRCLPWSRDIPCVVCQEACPVPEKAILLTHTHAVKTALGGENLVSLPVMKTSLCIGCGICEYQCPLQGTAAIRVERATDLANLSGPASG